MPVQIDVVLAFMLIISFLGAIALHEWAHAFTASLLGDHTAQIEERKTLNLRSHLEPIGILLCLILAFQPMVSAPAGFGWGKPVKPDPWKMRLTTNIAMILVALAGPILNLIVGLATGFLAAFLLPFLMSNPFSVRIIQLLVAFASVNLCITIFNIIPLYPLDGYQILYTLLPSRQAIQFARSAQYGPFIILALFFFVPFLARLAGVGDFPLFQLPYYIWYGAINLIALTFSHYQSSLAIVLSIYRL